MRLIRSIATIGIMTIGSRILGFLRTSMIAAYLGAGPMADALVIATKIPSVLRCIFAEGAFNAAFVPLFAGILAKEGPDRAKTYAENVFSILVLILSVIVVLAEIFMPQVIHCLVSGFEATPDRMAYTITFSRILFPFILFISICALYSGILNSLEKFAVAAASPIWGNAGTIVLAWLMIQSHTAEPAIALSWGLLFCSVIQALVVMIPAWRQGMRLRLILPQWSPDMRKFFVLLGPAALGSGVVQVNIFMDMLFGSLLPTGSIAYMEYADRLNQLPLSVIGAAMGTALLPILSKQIRLGDEPTVHKTQNLSLEYALVLSLPATLGLFFLAYPIVQTVFEMGKLTPKDTIQISHTLMAFACGLPAYILIKIFASVFFARQDTWTPVMVAMGAVGVNLGLNFMLYKTFAHVGLAASTAIAAWVNASILVALLYKRRVFQFDRRLLGFLPKVALAGLMGSLTAATLNTHAWPLFQGSKIGQISGLCLLCGAVLVVYLGLCFATGIFKRSDLRWPGQTKSITPSNATEGASS